MPSAELWPGTSSVWCCIFLSWRNYINVEDNADLDESDRATGRLRYLVERGTPVPVLDLAPMFYMSVLAYMDCF